MKNLFLLLMALVILVPTEIWNELTDEARQRRVNDMAGVYYSENPTCAEVEVTGTVGEKYVVFKFVCLKQKEAIN